MTTTTVQLNENLTIPQKVMQRFGFRPNQEIKLLDLGELLLIDLRKNVDTLDKSQLDVDKQKIVQEMAKMNLPVFDDWQEAKKKIVQEKVINLG